MITIWTTDGFSKLIQGLEYKERVFIGGGSGSRIEIRCHWERKYGAFKNQTSNISMTHQLVLIVLTQNEGKAQKSKRR